MELLLVLASSTWIVIILWEGFEAMVFPRRVTRRYRWTRLYYRAAWAFWRAAAQQIKANKRRETFLSFFGPLSLFGLFATWVSGLIVGFGLLLWALRTPLNIAAAQDADQST
jgi:hypothetical protein